MTSPEEEYREKLEQLDFYDSRFFKLHNMEKLEDPEDTIVSAYAVLLDPDASALRKKAALLLLKFLVRSDFLDEITLDDVAPYSRHDPRVRAWADTVKKPGKCAICGSTEDLQAHHILLWSEYPAGRLDLKNGVCLCRKCHAAQHEGQPAYRLILKSGRR